MAETRKQQKERTRRLLLETTYSLFAKQGFMATRAADIATAAGVAHGSLFVHFPTMEALVVAVVKEYGREIVRQTHELAHASRGLAQLLQAHLAGIRGHEAFYTRLVLENHLLPRPVQDEFAAILSVAALHFATALENEPRRRAGLPLAYLLFNQWIGLVHHYLANQKLFAPGGSVLAERGEELVQGFCALVFA